MAEPRLWIKIQLFLSSYFPLWIIFLVTLLLKDYPKSINALVNGNIEVLLPTVILTSIIAISMGLVLIYLRLTVKGTNPPTLFVKGKEDMTSEYMLYVVTYIIPFLADNFLELSKMISLFILMFTIGALYIRANLFHVNPMLNIFGYRLYKISDENDNKLILLSKQSTIKKNSELKANSLSGNIYVELDTPKS